MGEEKAGKKGNGEGMGRGGGKQERERTDREKERNTKLINETSIKYSWDTRKGSAHILQR